MAEHQNIVRDQDPLWLPLAGVAVEEEDRLRAFEARVRIDTPREAEYFRHGGILQYVLRTLLSR